MNLGGAIRLNKISLLIILCIFLIYSLNSFIKIKRTNSEINLRILLNVAIKAAENGGKNVVEYRNDMDIKSKGKTREGMEDSVTKADYLSHCSMKNTISHFYPKIKLISEETIDKCDVDKVDFNIVNHIPVSNDFYVNENDITIWIDPLDATHEYTEKLYQYVTTMVCVAIKGKPVIGVIHQPFSNKSTWSWVGIAKSDDLNKQKDLGTDLKVIVSRSHKGDIEKILKKNFDKIEIVSAAGAGYKALEVAKGNVNAYLHVTLIKKWDICAGNAIINSLGGKMLNKYGYELDYSSDDAVNENGLIASLNNYKDFIGKL